MTATDSPPNPPKPSGGAGPGPAGGWGSVKGMLQVARTARPAAGALDTLRRQNKPGGLMCTSCAWPRPAKPHAAEFCENGAKATLWELTRARCGPDFFAAHTVSELRGWRDHDLERAGRLTHPMRYDAETDRYVGTTWEAAFAEIGGALDRLRPDPDQAVFYASGHAGLEAGYLYALLARLYGTNNLPQSSNMCHETTSVGLKKVIGSPVGTILWEDLEQADAFFFFGQNPGSNSPRFLQPLQAAKERGAKVVAFNPIVEAGLVSFTNPQRPVEMATRSKTQIADQYLQVRSGGDVAAIMGLCKAVVERDDAETAEGRAGVIDRAFVAEHTTGFEDFIDAVRAAEWDEITAASGLGEADLRQAAQTFMEARAVIGVYGMGLTQHQHGALNIAMLVNLLLLGGHIGRPGAGACPVRGHSNVQGQRTVGVAERAALIPMDRLRELFGFEPPQADGMPIVDACAAMIDGRVRAFICLGGNLLRAVSDTGRLEAAWPGLDLSVMVSTKLNRSHLFPAKAAFILPCLGRAELDIQASGNQAVSVEDSFSMISGSLGQREPPSEHLKSELAIVAGIAQAVLPENPKTPWAAWVDDYSRVRDLIEATYPESFGNYNARLFEPGGFWRGNAARKRVWNTDSGRAEFTTPDRLTAKALDEAPGRYRLLTMRSHDQFNTTIYGYSDRLRGLEGDREILLMSPGDIDAAGFSSGQKMRLVTDYDDGHARALGGLTLTPYPLPQGTVAAYYPECNVLVPLGHHDQLSKTPASKSVPVRVEPDAPADQTSAQTSAQATT